MYFFVCVCVVSTEVMVKVHVVDLKTETIASPISVRAYLNQTITEFKQLIAQVPCSSHFHCVSFSFLNCLSNAKHCVSSGRQFSLARVMVSSVCFTCSYIIYINLDSTFHVFLCRQRGYQQNQCVWFWNGAIMTSGCSTFQTKHWKPRVSSGVTRSTLRFSFSSDLCVHSINT